MQFKKVRTLMLLLCVTYANPGFSGGWSGIGGELLEDAINPWFIQKGPAKKIVRYCIDSDETNFEVDRRRLSSQVRNAFDFWSNEFLSAHVPENGLQKYQVHVGRESFFEVACDSDDDDSNDDDRNDNIAIRFQFGTLYPKQLNEFTKLGHDPKKFVGIAIRTNYDPKTMQSRGFIYLSPSKGPLAMTGRDIVSAPWTADNFRNLSNVLKHELGHVFGLQHAGSHHELMGAGFPEYLVSSNNQLFEAEKGVFTVPYGKELYRVCVNPEGGVGEQVERFFFLPPTVKCLSYQFLGDKFLLVGRTIRDGQRIVVGEMVFEEKKMSDLATIIRLWLPLGQKLYPDDTGLLPKILVGPMVKRHIVSGMYRSNITNESRHMVIHMSPERIQIDGVMDDKIVSDILPN